jgi:hypothetical protein
MPPPGAGVKTVTPAFPGAAISVAEMVALNCVEDRNTVGRSVPFQRTTDPLIKFVPVTVSVNANPPALTEDGLKLEIFGAGLLIAKVRTFEVPPPGAGLTTVI